MITKFGSIRASRSEFLRIYNFNHFFNEGRGFDTEVQPIPPYAITYDLPPRVTTQN